MPRWILLRVATRPAHPFQAVDAADMGTAFGLDASFGNLPDIRLKSPARTAASPRLSRHTGLPRRD